MFGQMIQYWYLTGDTSYNSVVSEGIQWQVGENKDFMPRNQSKDLVRNPTLVAEAQRF